jgi:hypothetical protein
MRYSFISICAAIVVALALTSARAQQASPTPTPRSLVHVPMPIPVTPPKGWNPERWAALRAQCGEIFDKAHAGIPLSFVERQNSWACGEMVPWPASVAGPPSRQLNPPSPPTNLKVPTPIPTPFAGGSAP